MSSPFVPIVKADLEWHADLPFSKTFNDIYFSVDDALAESEHVFIATNRLLERWQAMTSGDHFTIAETGFGSGLNFLQTLRFWKKYHKPNTQLYYLSCELHPFALDDLKRCLNLWPELAEEAEALVKRYPILTPGFHQISFPDSQLELILMLGEASSCFEQLLSNGDPAMEKHCPHPVVDAWYLDGFAPSKNSELWSKSLFQLIAALSRPGTSLATFTAAGTVRAALAEVGFEVEKIRGYGRKRDMIRAQLLEGRWTKLPQRQTPWFLSPTRQWTHQKAVVVGAGLAGAFIAYHLSRLGWQVEVLEAEDQCAQGASGNPAAVVFPKLSAYQSPFTQFQLTAYLYAIACYQSLVPHSVPGALNGMMLLAQGLREQKTQQGLTAWLGAYPELGRLVTAEEGSALVGLPLAEQGLYIPQSGWINSPALCRWLLNQANITVHTACKVEDLRFQQGLWQLGEYQAEVVILANGGGVTAFEQTRHLPLKPMRGQMSFISENEQSQDLLIPLCGNGHVLPAVGGRHAVGASFHPGDARQQILSADNQANLQRLRGLTPGACWSDQIVDQWVGVRASTPDYLPLVGAVAEPELFTKDYARLASNAKAWVGHVPSTYPGLYVLAGFGSRGLTTVPLAAAYLAAILSNKPSPLPRSLAMALSPSRFLYKELIGKKSS